LVLRALFRSESTGNEFNSVSRPQWKSYEQRAKRSLPAALFLIVIGEGEVGSFEPAHERDAGDFIVCFDGVDKATIRALFQDRLTALLNSVLSEADTGISVRSIAVIVVETVSKETGSDLRRLNEQTRGKPPSRTKASTGPPSARAITSARLPSSTAVPGRPR
jgi:hypothetical protein